MTEHIRLIPVGGALSTDEESSHHPMVHMEIKRFQQHARKSDSDSGIRDWRIRSL